MEKLFRSTKVETFSVPKTVLLGQKLTLPWLQNPNASIHVCFTPKSGHVEHDRHVRFVPKADMQQRRRYSITWSASNCIEDGTLRPNALAVFILMTSSNLVGCSTGRSAGFAPFSILSTNEAARRNKSEMSVP